MNVRTHGESGPFVAVLHGGPGAPGTVAPVARALAGSFRVLEPFQRGSGAEPLTVARHVADLHASLASRCGAERPAIVGHSWGAMLALAYAAAHPDRVAAVVLIGCGTFDEEARRRLRATVEARMDDALRKRIALLEVEVPDPDRSLKALGELLLPMYSHELLTADLECASCYGRAHRETWDDMIRLQAEGVFPAAFASIEAPVLMLHGSSDPHPGPMIRASLEPHLPQLEYVEWPSCGHYPWIEKAVREKFFRVLLDWLEKHLPRP